MYGKSNMETYITRKLKLDLCINLEGWVGEGHGREV